MKLFLTEVSDPLDDKKFIGPYIKANNWEEAEKIAYEHELTLIGELHELVLDDNEARQIVH
tara:strand:- start:1157 stop:1339 length:183 start_codon:yes stop_codon:yes gene_type:complete